MPSKRLNDGKHDWHLDESKLLSINKVYSKIEQEAVNEFMEEKELRHAVSHSK